MNNILKIYNKERSFFRIKTIYYIVLFIIILFEFSACRYFQDEEGNLSDTVNTYRVVVADFEKIVEDTTVKEEKLSEFEQILIDEGLVDVNTIDPTILVDLKYSTKDNFLGVNMYGDLNKAYLQVPVAEKLAKAQKYLNDTIPGYSLIIYDAVRPVSIQKMMWDSIKVPVRDRHKYLSNPKYGSLHNFGAAVDLNIVDSDGNELDMGTPFDSFEEKAYPLLEKQMLEKGLLTAEQVENRKLLRFVMDKADFINLPTEWWHFSSCLRRVARERYAMIQSHKLEKEEIVIPEEVSEINITFKVQIRISGTPISTKSDIFKGIEVSRYYHEGMYKYTSGVFTDLESAHIYRDKMRTYGFSDCFVAGFNKNKRIGVKDAIELMQ